MSFEEIPELTVQVLRGAGSSVVNVSGEVDVANAARLGAALSEVVAEGERHVVVDLGAVEFIDLAGLDVLEDIGRYLLERDGHLELRRPSRLAARLLGLRAGWEPPPPWEMDVE